MTGNTRFMGFGKDNAISLERWGGKVKVALPPEGIIALRKACYDELPKSPPGQRNRGVSFNFQERLGITADFDLEGAKKLCSILADLPPALKDGSVQEWLIDLEMSINQLEGYLNTMNEPGVDGDGPTETSPGC